MMGTFSMFLAFTVVLAGKPRSKEFPGDIGWSFPCSEDSIFGFISGGDSKVEAVLGQAWGVGTTVTTYYHPVATDFANTALSFGNMITNVANEKDCKTPFKDWMFDTFATKEQTKKWIDLATRALEEDHWIVSSNLMNQKIARVESSFVERSHELETFIREGKIYGALDRYVTRLHNLRETLHTCVGSYLQNAATGAFNALDIAALAAGASCAIDFWGVVHLVYGTYIDPKEDEQSLINILSNIRSDVYTWEGWFNTALRQIKDRRRDASLLEYQKYEGSCETPRSCRTYSKGTTCVYMDRAFALDGTIEKARNSGGFSSRCDRHKCDEAARKGCTEGRQTAKWRIINSKRPVLDKKLEELRRRIFIIDFTKTTDVITQMIKALKNPHTKPKVNNGGDDCALKKDHACTGSRYRDYDIWESVGCMRQCNRISWCKCITMSKSFGCRIETGHVRALGSGGKYWAVNESACNRRVESWTETAVSAEDQKEVLEAEKVESAVASESDTERLKETNEALSAILRGLENQ